MPRPEVSVVICAYTERRWDDLMAAVDSVTAQTVAPREVLVCIDHNPGLAERVGTARPDVEVIENRHERGLSGARNTAIERAHGDIVAFLDDDAAAHPDWLHRLLDAFDDGVVAVGGSARPRWQQGRPRWFPEEFDWVVGCTHRGTPTQRASVRNVIGCNMAFRRASLQQAGGFNTGLGRIGSIPLGCEETELCIRLRQQDRSARVLLEPSSFVDHHVTADRHTLRYFWSRCLAEGASKSMVASLVGATDGMATERAYVTRVIPRAVGRHCRATLGGDAAGLLRVAAMGSGLAVFAVGYARAEMTRRRTRSIPRPDDRPAERPIEVSR